MSLQVSDTSVEKAGLLQTCESNLFGDNGYAQITGNASRLAVFINFLNEGYSRYFDKAMQGDGTWEIDDTNFTTVPIATADLVSGQQDYGLNTTHIEILGVEIKNSSGAWIPLEEVDESDFNKGGKYEGIAMSAYFDSSITGIPYQYNQIGASIFLKDTPNYNSTGGIKVRFQRPPSYFLTTDTTKAPGFTETHHTYLSDFATWKYASSRGLDDVANRYQGLVQIWEIKTIPEFYGRRNRKQRKVMSGRKIKFI